MRGSDGVGTGTLDGAGVETGVVRDAFSAVDGGSKGISPLLAE